jgi:hypothetical protein
MEWTGQCHYQFCWGRLFGKDRKLGNDVEVIGWWISLLVDVEDLVVARNPVRTCR